VKHIKLFENFGVYEALEGYLNCALWTGEFDDNDFDDIDSKSVDNARDDVDNFFEELRKHMLLDKLIKEMDLDSIGHDFWLTRNGNGVGFWDRDLGDLGDKVSKVCELFGGKDIYKGDDEKIYIE